MLISDRKWEDCDRCGHHKKLLSEEIYGCDHCGAVIDLNFRGREYLSLKAFNKNDRTEELTFCSWDCVFAALPNIRSDYFISLPYISFDSKDKKSDGAAFFRAIKKQKDGR